MPFSLRRQLGQRFRFFSRVVRIVREPNDFIFRNAALDQIVLHQFRDPRHGSQASSARNDDRRLPFPEQFRGSRRPIRVKIVIAQHDQRICLAVHILNDPGFRHKTKNGPPNKIQKRAKNHKGHKDNQVQDDSAPLRCLRLALLHEFGSSARNCAAACSGSSALK